MTPKSPYLRKKVNSLVTCIACISLLVACQQTGASGGPGAPLKVEATLSTEPIVGQEVVWRIEVYSVAPAFPNTRLEIELPEGVELVSGELNQVMDIPAGGRVPIDLVIRVTEPGEWKILALASFSEAGTGYGVAK